MMMKPTKHSKAWIVFLPIILAPLLLFGIPLISGKVLYWGTPALQFVPWREYAFDQLEQGVFPLWNSLNGMGAPLLANYQTAFYYPPGWILILGHWLAGAPGVAWLYTLLVPVHLAWAGIGMAVLVRSIGIKPLGQIIAGLSFGMSGYFVARSEFFSMIWTGAWMPWVLWAASGIASPFLIKEDRKRWYWMVLLTTLMLLAGHAQLSWYILLFAGTWVFFGAWFNQGIKPAFISAGLFIGLCSAAVVLSAVQLVPTLEYLLQSQRSGAYEYVQAMTYSFWPWRFLTFLNPDLFGNPGLGDYWGYATYWEDAVYIGVIPFFLAVRTFRFGWPKSRNNNRKGVRFLWIMILIGCVFALGSITPVFPWLFKHIPTFDLFQAPARWMIWTVTALCILAGISTAEWARPAGRTRFFLNLITFGFVAVLVGTGIVSVLLPEVKESLLRGFMYFAVVGLFTGMLALRTPGVETRFAQFWRPGIVLVLFLDLLGASLFLNSFISNSFYKPDAGLKNNTALTAGRTYLSATDEYDLKFGRYLKFTDTLLTDDFFTIRQTMLPNLNLLEELASANNFDPLVPARYAGWMSEIEKLPPAERINALEFMGVSAWIKPDSSGKQVVTYQSIQPEQMIRGFDCAHEAESAALAMSMTIEKVRGGDNAASQCIIMEQPVDLNANRPVQSLRITTLQISSNSFKFRVVSDSPGWLRVNQTWYPGWRAKVDGVETEVYHADYIFSGFSVPAGQHEVIFYYQPFSFIIGAIVSLVSLIFFIVIGIFLFRPSKIVVRDEHDTKRSN